MNDCGGLSEVEQAALRAEAELIAEARPDVIRTWGPIGEQRITVKTTDETGLRCGCWHDNTIYIAVGDQSGLHLYLTPILAHALAAALPVALADLDEKQAAA